MDKKTTQERSRTSKTRPALAFVAVWILAGLGAATAGCKFDTSGLKAHGPDSSSSIDAVVQVDASVDGSTVCVDQDGDGYGDNCPAGPDCDDTARGITGECKADGCPEGWILVPAGEFAMGCSPGNLCWRGVWEESPRHMVTLSAFCIQETEVSVEAFRECKDQGICAGEPSTSVANTWCNWSDDPENREEHPINCINWEDARQYCAAFMGGDLPTEAQWEKAARGTEERVFPWGGDPVSCDRANYDVNGAVVGRGCDTAMSGPGTWEVGSLSSGEGDSFYGLKDMGGNLWEWVQDIYSDSFYEDCVGGCTDPLNTGTGSDRAMRGGAFDDTETARLRAVARDHGDPAGLYHDVGYRCARPL